MLLTEMHKSQRTETTCTCGRKAQLHNGTRDFLVETKKITLNNVPHFHCSYCDKAYYETSTNIDDLLKYAYKNDLKEIDWDNRHLYI